MNLSRRRFMRQATGSLAAIALASHSRAAAAQPTIRVGACVVGLEGAKQAGLDGVEVGAVVLPTRSTSFRLERASASTGK